MRRVGGIALTVTLGALLVLFARHVQWATVADAVRDADPALLLLAVALNLLSLSAKGLRWWVFLRPLGVRSPWLVLRATFAGAALNNLVIAQGGEAARVMLVSRGSGVPNARVLSALTLERLLDAMCYVLLLVVATWSLDLGPSLTRWRGAASVAIGACAVAIAVLMFAAARHRGRSAASPAPTSAGRIASFTKRFLTGIGDSASPARVTVAIVLSIVAWSLQVATYHLVARAAHLSLPLAGSIAAMLTIGLSFLIRATPGNVGIFQLTYTLTVGRFGIPEEAAVAVALLIQAVQVIPILGMGMGVHMCKRKRLHHDQDCHPPRCDRL